MPKLTIVTVVLVGCLFSTQLIAQSSGADHAANDDSIVVQGKNEEELQLTEKALQQVLESTLDGEKAPYVATQLGRFEQKICPLVLGVPDEYKPVVQTRIRENAKRIGLEEAAEECAPNIFAIVTAYPHELIERLDSEYRPSQGYFQALYKVELDQLKASDGPSWAWQMVSSKLDHAIINSLDAPPVSRSPVKSRRIVTYPPIRFDSAFVIIDVDALNGVTWAQLADFITIRALAKIRSSVTKDSDRATLLTLFTDRQRGTVPQPDLTSSDLLMLRALYETRPDMPAERQIDAMSRYMAEREKGRIDDQSVYRSPQKDEGTP